MDVYAEKLAEFKKEYDGIISELYSELKELLEIHMITYSLEKAVAFFAENLSGARQVTAQEMAVVVEEVHLSSENNRKGETKAALDQYFALFESFTKGSKETLSGSHN